jgi:hypothetical protein
LVNDADAAIDIVRVRTSCDCVTVDLAARHVESHETVAAVARIDLSADPGFTGGLCPEAEFIGANGKPLFLRTLRASVIARGARSD